MGGRREKSNFVCFVCFSTIVPSPPPPIPQDLAWTWCNHVDVTNKIDDAGVSSIAESASSLTDEIDFPGDNTCCVTWTNAGNDGSSTFGDSGDGESGGGPGVGDWANKTDRSIKPQGLDTINNEQQLETVLDEGCGRVKVVNAINYCGSPASNILGWEEGRRSTISHHSSTISNVAKGCAPVGGYGFVVVRMSTADLEAKLWTHEVRVGLGNLLLSQTASSLMHRAATMWAWSTSTTPPSTSCTPC